MASPWSSTSTSSVAGPSRPVTPAAAGRPRAARSPTSVTSSHPCSARPASSAGSTALPADDPCVNTPPADAYWSLWWSDGKSGHWTYSSTGAWSLQIPDGGYVALSWQSGDGKATPRVTPTAHATAPASPSSPTSSPSPPAVVDARLGTDLRAPPRARPPRPPRRRPPPPPPARRPRPTRPSRNASPQPSKRPTGVAAASRRPTCRRPRRRPRRLTPPRPARTPACPGWVAPVLVGGAVRRGGRRRLRTPETRRRRLMRARLAVARLPRDLHPVAWWLWAVGLAVAASFTTNPWLLLMLIGVGLPGGLGTPQRVAVGRLVPPLPLAGPGDRGDPRGLPDPRGRGRRRPRAAHPADDPVAALDARAPAARLGHPGVAALRPVRRAPSRDHRDLRRRRQRARQPQAAAPLGAAGALRDRQRARRRDHHAAAPGRQLPAGPGSPDPARRRGRRVRGLRRLLVPVLEDSLERSLALAAGMDTRGYGRTAGATARERRTTGGLMLLGLCAICVGVYGALDHTTPAWVGSPMLVVGVVVSLLAVRGAGRRVGRTRYRPAPWLWPEAVVAASGGGRGAVGLVDVAPPADDRLPLADRRADSQRARRSWPPASPSAVPCAHRCPPYGGEVPRDRAARCRVRVRRPTRAPRRRPRPRRGRAGRRLRAHRRRQVHPARRRDRAGAALHRRHPVRRRADRRSLGRPRAAARARPPRRVRRPGPGGRLRHRHRRGGARLRHGAARPRPRHHAPPGRGDPRPARRRRPARARPAHPVRRRAAAGRHRLGADHAPAGPRARRADLGARPDRGRGGARHPDPARARPRAVGADGRAPAGAGGAVRRPDGAAHRRRHGAGRRAGRDPRRLARRTPDHRARPPPAAGTRCR